MNHRHLAAIEKVIQAMKAMSAAELDRLDDPNFEVQIKLIKRRSEASILKASFSLEELSNRLAGFVDRAAALSYLRSVAATKKELELVARHFEMVIAKQDTVDLLAERIIETTVGARLRSRAIQGNPIDERSSGLPHASEKQTRVRD
ncbi:hypothetical protein [Cupriavidus campinensis]|uniref:hypothetical protein n=1 Tax=Cupriavidus campinensis TaxID=151783 RepID=UPI0011EE5DBF|nr:hypothetical protein [Cupriavidus campinensis]